MINSWGVGTNLITSKGNPAFGGVYKLAAIKNAGERNLHRKSSFRRIPKRSRTPEIRKFTAFTIRKAVRSAADLICLEEENYTEDQDIILFDPIETWKKTKIHAGTFTLREIMVQVFKNGECVYNDPATTMEIRDRCLKEQATMWDETRRLVNPHQMYVDLSDKLYAIKSKLLEEMSWNSLK